MRTTEERTMIVLHHDGCVPGCFIWLQFLCAYVGKGVGVGLFDVSESDDSVAGDAGDARELTVDHFYERLKRLEGQGLLPDALMELYRSAELTAAAV